MRRVEAKTIESPENLNVASSLKLGGHHQLKVFLIQKPVVLMELVVTQFKQALLVQKQSVHPRKSLNQLADTLMWFCEAAAQKCQRWYLQMVATHNSSNDGLIWFERMIFWKVT
jgi:uncharacterized membrane protein